MRKRYQLILISTWCWQSEMWKGSQGWGKGLTSSGTALQLQPQTRSPETGGGIHLKLPEITYIHSILRPKDWIRTSDLNNWTWLIAYVFNVSLEKSSELLNIYNTWTAAKREHYENTSLTWKCKKRRLFQNISFQAHPFLWTYKYDTISFLCSDKPRTAVHCKSQKQLWRSAFYFAARLGYATCWCSC